MARMLRRAARLLLAGALGVATSAAAPLAAQDAPRSLSSIQITASQMRLEAMKVEMALLADYATYNLPLQVRVEEDGLSLHGQVGDEQAREHALRVARRSCYLPVKDALNASAPRPPVQSVHVDAMRRTVRDVLDRSLGGRLSDLDVRINGEGQVTLAGRVDTVEDKVAASRALRGLPGCYSVVNCLDVQTFQQAGHTVTLITRDGQHAVHGALAPSEATAQKPNAAEPESSRPRVRRADEPVPLPPPPSTNIPAGLPPARDVYVRLKSVNQVAPVTYAAPPSGYAKAPPPPAPVAAPAAPAPAQAVVLAMPYGAYGATVPQAAAAKPSLKPRVSMFDRMWNLFGHGEPPAQLGAPGPAAPAPVQYVQVAPQSQGQQLVVLPVVAPSAAVAYYTGKTPAPAPQPAPAVAQKAPSSAQKAPPPAPAKQPPPHAVVRGDTDKWPPAHAVGAAEKPAPQGVMSNSPAIRLAAHPELAAQAARPAPKPKPATVQASASALTPPPPPTPEPVLTPTSARETPGKKGTTTQAAVKRTVAETVEPPVPQKHPAAAPARASASAPATAASMASHGQLHQVVTKACGKLARSVRVETASDGRPVVHIDAATSSEEELIGKLLSVPEIASSNVRIQIVLPK